MEPERRSGGWRSPPTARQEHYRSVLLAALNTSYYAEMFRAAGVGTGQAIGEAGSLEQILAKLPRLDPGLIPLESESLLNPAEPFCREEFFWPLPPPSRTAVLAAQIRESPGLRVFRDPGARGLERWRPEALAGPVEALRPLAEGRRLSRSLSRCVLALIPLRKAFLTEEARELFWSAWRVPVFGQVFGFSRELLAWECEAHQGYHFDPARVVFEFDGRDSEPELLVTSLVGLRRPAVRVASCLTGRIESTACGCGRSLPRLEALRPRSRGRLRAAAAAGAGSQHGVLR